MINGMTYVRISLRLPFGGSPSPANFCTVSDIVTGCINDWLECNKWDESKVCSEQFVKHIPLPEPLAEDISFAQERDMCVDLPIEDNGKCDGYIDNLISVCVDIANNLQRLTAGPCTIIHAMAHAATDGETFLARYNMVPMHKCTAWSTLVNTFIVRSSTKYEGLSSVIGCLENITIMFKWGAHFLNNFRALEIKANAMKHVVKIPI